MEIRDRNERYQQRLNDRKRKEAILDYLVELAERLMDLAEAKDELEVALGNMQAAKYNLEYWQSKG